MYLDYKAGVQFGYDGARKHQWDEFWCSVSGLYRRYCDVNNICLLDSETLCSLFFVQPGVETLLFLVQPGVDLSLNITAQSHYVVYSLL